MDNSIFDEEKLHRFIKEAIQRVINENKVKEEHRALSAEELLQYGISFLEDELESRREVADFVL